MKKFLVALLIIILAISMLLPTIFTFGEDNEGAESNPDVITFVFTHDIHSHIERFPQLASLIDEQRKIDPDTYVVDAGDFAMGTPYQTIYKKEAAELRMMGFIGFDITTLGNHEFDFRSRGLTEMLNRAVQVKQEYDEADKGLHPTKRANMQLPKMVNSNIDWEKTLGDETLMADGEALKQALENYGSQEYIVIEKNGKKVAFFGIFGKQSADYAPESGTVFADPIKTAKRIVKKIQKETDADLIVCLSHSGTNPLDRANSEDENLAANVDGIDMIVSGHSHTMYRKPLIVNGTLIASMGEYAQNGGVVSFTRGKDGFELSHYEIKPVEKYPAKESVVKEIEKYKALVDEKFFEPEGWTWNQVIAKNDYEFTDTAAFGMAQGDDSLGNLLADSFVHGVKVAEGDSYQPVDVTVIPAGIVRGTFHKGDITAADAYNVLSLGTGKDGEPGYPLVSIYLTGDELKNMAEVDGTVSEMMHEARLFTSGLVYTVNPNRMPLNKIEEIYKLNGDTTTQLTVPYGAGKPGSEEVDAAVEAGLKNGAISELEGDKLYRVVGDLYSCQMIGSVGEKSKGLLDVAPKDKDGNVITNFEDHIIYRADGKELKEWYAVVSYVDSFEGDKVPARYEKADNRKIVNDDGSIGAFFRNPNKIFLMAIGVIILALAIIALLIVLIVKLVKRIIFGKPVGVPKASGIFGPGGGGISTGRQVQANSIFKKRKNKYKSRW